MNVRINHLQPHTDAWLQDIYEHIVSHDEKPYVFIEMNIKHFRYLNVKYGVAFGNKVLRETLRILTEVLDEGYAALSSNDTFTMLVPFAYDQLDIEILLRRIVDPLFDIAIPEINQNFYTSFGVYYLQDHPEFEVLKTYAAIARKEEPTLSKRTFSYEVLNKPGEDVLTAYIAKHELEGVLTAARFHNEFKIYIQPKIDVHTHTICGGEVLTRWIRDDQTMIPLTDFMPVLKENGELYMVDRGHFETMCQLLKERETQGEKVVPISFNITNRSVFSENFIEDYIDIYHTYEPSRSLIEFEFMEDIHYDQAGEALSVMQSFHQEGFLCSLDDFGNGVTSFNALLSGNVDIIKMDHLFFTGRLDDTKKRIIHDIIDIAKAKHIKVLAEGVETKEYADYVEAEGCDYIQGFYYYKPMPAEEFFALLDSEPICIGR